jgi:hypothetical protein
MISELFMSAECARAKTIENRRNATQHHMSLLGIDIAKYINERVSQGYFYCQYGISGSTAKDDIKEALFYKQLISLGYRIDFLTTELSEPYMQIVWNC